MSVGILPKSLLDLTAAGVSFVSSWCLMTFKESVFDPLSSTHATTIKMDVNKSKTFIFISDSTTVRRKSRFD